MLTKKINKLSPLGSKSITIYLNVDFAKRPALILQRELIVPESCKCTRAVASQIICQFKRAVQLAIFSFRSNTIIITIIPSNLFDDAYDSGLQAQICSSTRCFLICMKWIFSTNKYSCLLLNAYTKLKRDFFRK